jgi:UDP-galactose transporter
MFYNNLLSIPILVIGSILCEDWSESNIEQNFPRTSRHHQVFAMLYSGVAAIFISYTSAWCIRVTSSTTYSMVGALNKLPLAVSGLVLFGDPVTVGNVSAIIMGFVSGLIYTWAKVTESAKMRMALPTQEPRGELTKDKELES